jgi:hypothetical protein
MSVIGSRIGRTGRAAPGFGPGATNPLALTPVTVDGVAGSAFDHTAPSNHSGVNACGTSKDPPRKTCCNGELAGVSKRFATVACAARAPLLDSVDTQSSVSPSVVTRFAPVAAVVLPIVLPEGLAVTFPSVSTVPLGRPVAGLARITNRLATVTVAIATRTPARPFAADVDTFFPPSAEGRTLRLTRVRPASIHRLVRRDGTGCAAVQTSARLRYDRTQGETSFIVTPLR